MLSASPTNLMVCEAMSPSKEAALSRSWRQTRGRTWHKLVVDARVRKAVRARGTWRSTQRHRILPRATNVAVAQPLLVPVEAGAAGTTILNQSQGGVMRTLGVAAASRTSTRSDSARSAHGRGRGSAARTASSAVRRSGRWPARRRHRWPAAAAVDAAPRPAVAWASGGARRAARLVASLRAGACLARTPSLGG